MEGQDSHLTLSALLSRRDLLRYAGYGAIALSQMELLAAAQAQGQRGGPLRLLAAQNSGTLQLPFWSDAAGWNQPQYYETIQAGLRRQPKSSRFPNLSTYADVNNDGQDELLVRGPNGLQICVYDPPSGQWLPMQSPLDSDGNPIWTVAEGWGPPYYQTIQTVSLAGGNYSALSQLLARNYDYINLWGYDFNPGSPTYGKWVQFPNGPAWSDAAGWNQPQYYETIQTGYLSTRMVLIGRGPDGIEAWTCNVDLDDPNSTTWTQLPGAPAWSDKAGWNLPQHYQTIQCSALAANNKDVLIGQGPDELEVWWLDLFSPTWVQQPSPWTGNYDLPSSYRTIQCADIDNDGATELLVRDPKGIQVWKFVGAFGNPPDGRWSLLPAGPAWSDANGWYKAEYYETIQCADIDGDGFQELIGRAPDNDPQGPGIQVWKFVPGPGYPDNPVGTWTQMPSGPAWTDAVGWNKVEHYSTIQSTTVQLPNFNANQPQNALLGRGPLGMQAWYYDPTAKTWQQTSASYPAFTPSQKAAYIQLDTSLRGSAANGNIRSVYNDEEANFSVWTPRMYTPPPADYNIPPAQRPHTNKTFPPPVGVSQADWDAVTWQIYWEMSYVGTPSSSINDYFGTKVSGLIGKAFPAQGFTLDSVGGTLGLPPDSSANVVLSILALLAEVAGAVAGFPEISAAAAGAVSNLLGVAFSASAEFLPNGGGGFQIAYNQLQTTLSKGFGQTLAANANNQFAITGGTDGSGNYVPGDWGLMSVVGPFIQNGVWDWPSSIDGMVAVMQQSYGVTVSQALLPAVPWIIDSSQPNEPGASGTFPAQYLFRTEDSDGQIVSWITGSNFDPFDFPPTSALSMIFDPAVKNQWSPLGTPLADVYTGANGWPQLDGSLSLGASRQPRRQVPGGDLHMVADLTRDALTGEIVVAITLLNRGLSVATNVEITGAELQGRRPLSSLPTRHTRLAKGTTRTLTLRFPNLTAGATVVMRVSGRYLGGTFGGSFRIKIP